MMATVPHVTSGSGLGKFQADGFLLDSVQAALQTNSVENSPSREGKLFLT